MPRREFGELLTGLVAGLGVAGIVAAVEYLASTLHHNDSSSDSDSDTDDDAGPEPHHPKPPVALVPLVLVPGIAGSILAVRPRCGAGSDDTMGSRCWVTIEGANDNFAKLLGRFRAETGEVEMLHEDLEAFVPSPPPPADPGHLFAISRLDPDLLLPVAAVEYYSKFASYLRERGYEDGKTLFGAGFDWRQSLRLESHLRALLARLREASEASGGGPVDVVSHSMGGLLVKATLAKHPEEFGSLVRRWVSIGSPWLGASGFALNALIDGVQFAHGFAAAFFVSRETTRQVVLQSPSMYELLPRGSLVGQDGLTPNVTVWWAEGADPTAGTDPASPPSDRPRPSAITGSPGWSLGLGRSRTSSAGASAGPLSPPTSPSRPSKGRAAAAPPAPPSTAGSRDKPQARPVIYTLCGQSLVAPDHAASASPAAALGTGAVAEPKAAAAAAVEAVPGPACRSTPSAAAVASLALAPAPADGAEVGTASDTEDEDEDGACGARPAEGPPTADDEEVCPDPSPARPSDTTLPPRRTVTLKRSADLMNHPNLLYDMAPRRAADALDDAPTIIPPPGAPVRTFEGLLESILDGNSVDIDGWDVLLPYQHSIMQHAAETRTLLDAAVLPAGCRFYNIWGSSFPTAFSAQYGDPSCPVASAEDLVRGEAQVTYTLEDGDGVVPAASASCDGLQAWARVARPGTHRGMLADPAVFHQVHHWLTSD